VALIVTLEGILEAYRRDADVCKGLFANRLGDLMSCQPPKQNSVPYRFETIRNDLHSCGGHCHGTSPIASGTMSCERVGGCASSRLDRGVLYLSSGKRVLLEKLLKRSIKVLITENYPRNTKG
jgi:hypothetical protein